jgi:2-oxoglutarate ferredoxin oxidoreductase subunit delta
VIKGTIDCVSHHDEAVPYDVPEPGQVIADVRALTNRRDCCHTQPDLSPGIINPDFRGVFCHLERGDSMAKGRVSIVVERCKACGFCVEFCPSHVLALSSAFNSKGYHPPHVVHPEKCSGCDLCGMYCPDFAICATKADPAGSPAKKADSAKEGDK